MHRGDAGSLPASDRDRKGRHGDGGDAIRPRANPRDDPRRRRGRPPAGAAAARDVRRADPGRHLRPEIGRLGGAAGARPRRLHGRGRELRRVHGRRAARHLPDVRDQSLSGRPRRGRRGRRVRRGLRRRPLRRRQGQGRDLRGQVRHAAPPALAETRRDVPGDGRLAPARPGGGYEGGGRRVQRAPGQPLQHQRGLDPRARRGRVDGAPLRGPREIFEAAPPGLRPAGPELHGLRVVGAGRVRRQGRLFSRSHFEAVDDAAGARDARDHRPRRPRGPRPAYVMACA